MNDFLPINKKEMLERGWQDVDFVFVTGDSYVDHPSFGVAILTRLLEKEGYRVAVLSQPNWKNDGDFTQFGRPRLAFMVTSGNIDSMVAHYTAAKRLRHDDAYTAGGIAGKRPDRAVIVYSNIIGLKIPGVLPLEFNADWRDLDDFKRHIPEHSEKPIFVVIDECHEWYAFGSHFNKTKIKELTDDAISNKRNQFNLLKAAQQKFTDIICIIRGEESKTILDSENNRQEYLR